MSTPRASRRSRISTAVAASATLGLLAVTACGADDSGGGGTDGELAVTASFYPMAFLAERIGGEHVDVTTLTEPGVDPHDLDLSPQQVGELGEADVIAYVEGLQPAVDDAIGQSGVEHVVEASALVQAPPASEDGDAEDDGDHEDEHDHEDDDHGHDHGGDDDHDHDGDDDHGHDHDHDHDHGEGDPHFWTDPLTYAVAAQGVADALAEASPDHADVFQENADELTAELEELDSEFEEGLADRRTDTIITTHAAFGYLAERYGLNEESIAGLDPESEPSGARMRELHTVAERDDVSTVFFEVLASEEMAHTLAEDLGLRTDVLDPVEGITEESRGDDYVEVMRANLAALQEALTTGP